MRLVRCLLYLLASTPQNQAVHTLEYRLGNQPITVHVVPERFKKQKTFSMFLFSYRNTSGGLGEREMLWEHKPRATVSTAFSSSPKPSQVFL